MSRPELAAAMKKAPSWIFRLEDPNEKPPTVSTLLQVADAYDTDLNIFFGSFAGLLDRIQNMSSKSFEVPSFNEEVSGLEEAVKGEEAQWHSAHATSFVQQGLVQEVFPEAFSPAFSPASPHPFGKAKVAPVHPTIVKKQPTKVVNIGEGWSIGVDAPIKFRMVANG